MFDHFNYVVTIHNKADLLPSVLSGIQRCASVNSRIYCVLDGCTDASEAAVDTFISTVNFKVQKVITPDVHELRSINAALRLIDSGCTVILQDDVVLGQPDLEDRLRRLYATPDFPVGVVSMRLASNVRQASLLTQLRMRSLGGVIEECDLITRPDDGMVHATEAQFEYFYPRIVAIKGPNVIPWSVLSEVGLLDERLAPYGFDDHEYCLRSMRAGFVNGLFPLKFTSEPSWGTTRQNAEFRPQSGPIHRRNRRLVWAAHHSELPLASLRVSELPFRLAISP